MCVARISKRAGMYDLRPVGPRHGPFAAALQGASRESNKPLVALGVSSRFGLGAVSGYIRADEATKGYYTRRLRMLAAAGVGAAGVILYRMVA